MKILLLIDGMGIGGAETHVLTLARSLLKRGTHVDVMCDGGVYTDALRSAGIRVYLAPFKKRDFFSVLKSIRALYSRRAEAYDVIHAHTRFTAALANFCLPRIPLVTTVHLDFSLSAAKRTLSCWGRMALAVSPDLKEYLIREYGVKNEDILLTNNGIDPEDFPPLPIRGRDILHVSRLDKDRSLTAHLLCEIAPALHRHSPNVKIRIYGGGNDFDGVAAAAERANRLIGTTVVFLHGSTQSVATALKSASVFVGVSRAMLEAACSAIPCILSGNDGYGGILTEDAYEKRKNDNFCCRFCERPTTERLLFDLCFLLDHACFCERIRLCLAARVRDEYAPERMAEDAVLAYYGALRIGIIGYYGFGNFGDEMMLHALSEKLRSLGVRTVLPLKRKGEVGALSRRHPLHSLRALRGSDTVLFGGGNLLQNETSPRSFFYYALLILLCRKNTLMGVGMGIGELRGKTFEAICARLLRRFKALYFRTEGDKTYALKLAPELADKMHLSCDPCLYLPTNRGFSTRKKKIIAIPKETQNKDFFDFLIKKQKEGYEILPLCLFPSKDTHVAEELAASFGTRMQVIHAAEDFFAAAEDAAFCITERLHGAVFSLLSHTPCILFSESKKCIAFAKDVAMAAKECSTPCPIIHARSLNEALQKEREAQGIAFGFSEIISFLRNR